MPFIGNTPDVNFTSFAKQTITGNGGTSYTLSHAVANENEVEIFVNNVRQEGGSGKAYTVNGTALTMTGNVANTDSFYVIFLGKALQTTVPPDGSVSTAKIADDAVDLTSKVTGVLPEANSQTNTPAFQAYLGGSDQSASNDTTTLVTINTEEFDTNSAFNTSTYRFTPQVAGKYFIYGNLCGAPGNGNLTRLELEIHKNGSQHRISSFMYNISSAIGTIVITNVQAIITMNGSSDYVDLRGRLRTNNGSSVAFGAGIHQTYFGGYKLIGV